jgi:hypothetical protein
MTSHPYRPSSGFRFPGGKTFAFSVFDDTDVATERSVRPLYELLASLGMRTTKSVWPIRYDGPSHYAGSHTLEDLGYAEFVRELAGSGFEIAFHGATMASATRDEVLRALEAFRGALGCYPRSYSAHSVNRENLYWGADRFGSRVLRRMYAALSAEAVQWFQGHVEGSPYFWGDLSLQHLAYVRGFTFDTLNLWRLTRHVCYEDPRTPWVRRWFVSADADNVEEFVRLLDEANQDRLEREGGLCFISTHFGKGFVIGGRVEGRVQQALTRMAQRDGWFAPVSEILDYLDACGLVRRISVVDRHKLELLWFLHSLRRRLKRRTYFKAELQYLESAVAERRS